MDPYAKTVLTVIAVALCAIALQNSGVLGAKADTPSATRVLICDSQNTFRCAGISEHGELNVSASGTK